ncbi:DNA methyltransferase [Vibrio natriegens]|uniref:DNA methyltransferase n=1 Tax=Vibrio natriegens TaxID=691 RepID=UPI003F826812
MQDVKRWTRSTAEGRWCGFGPYYAMFPVEFAKNVVQHFGREGSKVLDPFCGRGTTPYVSMCLGFESVGIDIGELGWLYSSVKVNPESDFSLLINRANEIKQSALPSDFVARNEFQSFAWCKNVLGFLNSARRNLDWMNCNVDRTLMGIILVNLHGKIGEGLSNQMRQSKALSPDYSVRWWKERNLFPPELDPVEVITKKIQWRYAKGIPAKNNKCNIYLGDSKNILSSIDGNFDLLLTSPPYCGVTNYRYDQWMRYWMLGDSELPLSSAKDRYVDKVKYKDMINGVFLSSSKKMVEDSVVYVRTDARAYTLEVTSDAVSRNWPDHIKYMRPDSFKKTTQTALFGDKEEKPGEVDILALPKGRPAPTGFITLE